MTPSSSPSRRTTSAGLPLTTVGSAVTASRRPWRAADEEAGHLVGADDRPQRGLLDAAAVAHQDDVRGEHVEQALQVPGRRAPAGTTSSAARVCAGGDRLARAAGVDVLAGAVGDLADGRGALVDGGRDLVVADVEDLAQHEDGALGRRQRLEDEHQRHRHALGEHARPRPRPAR